MFICVSPNPAIDKRLSLQALVPGRVLRARAAQSFPGGKSTHAAMVLRTLGETPQWIGSCGGVTGSELIARLSELGIQAHICPTQQPTRTNLEIIEANGSITEILEPGSALSVNELTAFENACKNLFSQCHEQPTVIFSGSLPAGAPADLYSRLLGVAQQLDCRTFLDSSGEPLRLALAARPEFVKPNRDEAESLLGMTIDSPSEAVRAIHKLFSFGARSVALSLGADGLYFCPAERAPILFASAPHLNQRSTVGCGDSALAGFAQAIVSGASPEGSLRLAAACAAANCLAPSPGTARLEDIRQFENQISVQELPPSW